MKTLLLFIAIFAISVPSLYAEFPDSNDIELIKTGIGLTLNEDYQTAKSLYSELQAKYPAHPCGPFFMATVYQAEMKDYEDFKYEQEFVDNIELSIELADDCRDENRHDAWAYYFMGGCNLYRALFEGRKGSSWSAARKGIRAKNLLEKCLDLDSTIHDARAGLGSYRYWGDVKGGVFAKLPFVGGDRGKGLEDLKKAVEKSTFSRDLALSALAFIYIQEEKYDTADSMASALRGKYPQGKSFLWARAFANFGAERYEKALSFFDSLRAEIKEEGQPNNYNQYEISYYKTLCYYNLENYTEAMIEIDNAEHLILSDDVRNRLQDMIDEVEEHKEKIREILSGNR
jgi:tetratricopeptide (TPR) repeat protein